MKAAIRKVYGGPEVLNVEEVAIPVPKGNELLIRVYAATVNRTDCGVLTGKPYLMRLFAGFPNPRLQSTGTDFAGVVEAVGEHVTLFKTGDKVWGLDDNGIGSHAQYLTVSEKKGVQLIPEGISFETAAASAEGAHYAYNFINKIKLKPGLKILVNGATGAIGSAAVQLLKHFDVTVTAVCNTENLDLVKSLGADVVIDYRKEDFTRQEQKFHFVFDAVGKSRFKECNRLLLPGGVYLSTELGPGAENVYLPLLTLFSNKKVIFPIPYDIGKSLSLVGELLSKGTFRPVIDRRYELDEIRQAFEYVMSGQKTGNVLLKLQGE